MTETVYTGKKPFGVISFHSFLIRDKIATLKLTYEKTNALVIFYRCPIDDTSSFYQIF